MRIGVLLIAILQAAAPSQQVNVFPSGVLQVAYRQEYEGKTDERAFLAKLECWGGNCELTSVDLGWCLPLGPRGERSSLISTGHKSTADGNLEVRATLETTRGVLIVEEEESGAKITYRFGFSLRSKQADGRVSIDRLTDFSGAAVKNSPSEEKVVSWKLVPFVGDKSLFSLPCKFLFPGVPKK